MSKEDRRKLAENIAEAFLRLDENGKSFIAGYIAAKSEEHQRQDREARKAPVA